MNSFIAALTAADIVILHAGASALHAIQAGKVPVIVPRRACFDELVDDHQIEFARQLEGMGLAVVVEDVADLARAVEEVRTIRVQALASRPPPLVRMVAEILDRRARDEEYR
jgi:UDP-N-acetylglucosamine transferase subunit ALG13